jgi:predicted acyl esterase
MKRVSLLLVVLAATVLIPRRPSLAAEDAPRVRFPADVPPRNDIRLENRVPIPMRDGVILYADVYRPVGEALPHRLRHHFPQFDRNPNTGAPFGTTDKVGVAQQTVYHDAEHASHILLPVIPRRQR